MFLKMGKIPNKFKTANLLLAKIVNPLFLTKEKRKKNAENQQESAGNVENDAPEASEKSDEQRASLRRQNSESSVSDATPKERALRDALNDVLTSAGIDVVTDVEEGQRVMDEANGDARMMGSRVNGRMEDINS